jgi:acyl carrier protein
VVSVREDASGGKRLIAYIVTSAGQHLTPGQLRNFLKEKLPEYMIPNVFVFLASLPLMASGKVDRGALPAPDASRADVAEAYVAPRNQNEELLAGVWAEVLKLDNVGIHDNFFELGGHSLLATRVVSKIREILRIELPLRALFEMPTVASLSEHIEAIKWAAEKNQLTVPPHPDRTEEIIL